MGRKKEAAKKKRAWWVYVLWVIGTLAALVCLVFEGARLYFRIPVSDYYKASEKGFVIPDCNKGFVAQGLTYHAADRVFLAAGYQQDEAGSPVYVIAPGGRKAENMVRMALPDGSMYQGHAGGIAVNGEYVYVADGGKNRLLVFSYESIRGAAYGETVKAVGTFETAVSDTDYVGPAFVSVDGNQLVVGEFYRDPQYPTPESHKLTTLAGDYQQALAVVYELNDRAQYGIAPTPVQAYSLPDLAQGICFDGDDIYVSTSWGVSNSHIYRYDRGSLQLQGDIWLLGENLPLYALDSAALRADRVIAPMSEEIALVDGKLYVMCESASNKYFFGKLTSAKWCYATDAREFWGP